MTKPNNSQPLVTIYMPTYNRADLLKRAVESVLDQDYKNIELIVVDDGSTDSTHEYLARIAKKDSRFKYFINEKNSGACVSRNKAIFAANGKYITGLDDDDFFLPNRISQFIKAWQHKDTDCIAIYSNVSLKTKKQLLNRKKITSCDYNELIISNWIGNQLFTKTVFLREVGGFDESFPAWQDLDCWYRVLKQHKLKAYLDHSYTYVVDESHSHERITTSRKKHILEAYRLFCDKHCLNNKEKKLLALQLNPYIEEPASLNSILQGLLTMPKISNLKRSILLLLSKTKRTLYL